MYSPRPQAQLLIASYNLLSLWMTRYLKMVLGGVVALVVVGIGLLTQWKSLSSHTTTSLYTGYYLDDTQLSTSGIYFNSIKNSFIWPFEWVVLHGDIIIDRWIITSHRNRVQLSGMTLPMSRSLPIDQVSSLNLTTTNGIQQFIQRIISQQPSPKPPPPRSTLLAVNTLRSTVGLQCVGSRRLLAPKRCQLSLEKFAKEMHLYDITQDIDGLHEIFDRTDDAATRTLLCDGIARYEQYADDPDGRFNDILIKCNDPNYIATHQMLVYHHEIEESLTKPSAKIYTNPSLNEFKTISMMQVITHRIASGDASIDMIAMYLQIVSSILEKKWRSPQMINLMDTRQKTILIPKLEILSPNVELDVSRAIITLTQSLQTLQSTRTPSLQTSPTTTDNQSDNPLSWLFEKVFGFREKAIMTRWKQVIVQFIVGTTEFAGVVDTTGMQLWPVFIKSPTYGYQKIEDLTLPLVAGDPRTSKFVESYK